MRKSLQNLYENMLITEVVGALNYWLTPNGDFIKVDHHLGYAQKNFKIDKWPEYTHGVSWAQFESELYDTVYRMGFVRVVEQPATIYFTYSRAKTPNKAQAQALFDLATDKKKNLVDGETQKTLIKNNEIDADVARNDKLYKAEKELKPDFYKKRRDYGEGFSKHELNDYTKLIYEYNIKGEVDSPDNTNDYRKDIPKPEPLPKNKEDDYRHAIIGDAIDGIKQAHAGKGIFDLKNTVQYWKDHLHIKGFTDEEIRQVIEMGLGYFDKVRKNPYKEKFSKYGLSDYTKLIYEYNVNTDDSEYGDDSEFGSYRKGIPIPKDLPDDMKTDNMQELINHTIGLIRHANEKDKGSLDAVLDWVEEHLFEKGFEIDQILNIIDMGMGNWDNFRPISEAHSFTDPDKRDVFKDAVSSIANAVEENMGSITKDVMEIVHYWRKIMFQKGFSAEEVKRVLDRAIGRE